MTLYNPNLDLINVNVYTKFGLIRSIGSQDIERKPTSNAILTSIKGCNSVANLRTMTLYNPNLDLINVNVYTKFGLIRSIGSPDIERKRNPDMNQGP